MASEHTRYLGVLGLLSECSVYVPEELRETIQEALTDAAEDMPRFSVVRIMNRVELREARSDQHIGVVKTQDASTDLVPIMPSDAVWKP